MRLGAPGTDLLHAHGQRQCHGPVQVLILSGADRLHTGEVPGGLGEIRQIDDLLQSGHPDPAGGVPLNGPEYILRYAEQIPGRICPGAGMEDPGLRLFESIQDDTIFFHRSATVRPARVFS